ncbi:unnamed protein product, partial [Candidula unifasciata]
MSADVEKTHLEIKPEEIKVEEEENTLLESESLIDCPTVEIDSDMNQDEDTVCLENDDYIRQSESDLNVFRDSSTTSTADVSFTSDVRTAERHDTSHGYGLE